MLHVELLPELSNTLIAIVWGPRPTIVPAARSCVIVSEAVGVQLSWATTCDTTSGTGAWQFASDEPFMSVGQEPVGGVVSTALTTTVACAEEPQGSVTVSVTTFVPSGREAVTIAFVPRTVPPKLHSKVSGSLSGSLEAEPLRVTWA